MTRHHRPFKPSTDRSRIPLKLRQPDSSSISSGPMPLARDFDRVRALLDRSARELTRLQSRLEQHDAVAGMACWPLDTNAEAAHPVEGQRVGDLQAVVEELRISNSELVRANAELERRVAERSAAIEESERQLSLAQLYAGAGTWDWRIDTDRVHWSDSCRDLYGHDPNSTSTCRADWIASLHPADRGMADRAIQDCLTRGGTHLHVLYRITHPDKGLRWLEGRGHVTYDEAGRPLRATGLAIDVTERRLAEEAVRENEGRLAAIFAQAEVGLSEIGLDGRFRRVNDRLCALLGRSRDDLLGLGVQDVTHPDDLARNLPLFASLVEVGDVFSIEKRYLRPDGTHFWAVSSVSRILGAGGEPLGVIAVTVDLTERRDAEDRLRAAHDEAVRARAGAEEANRAKSRFLAAASHDLRQPVTAANLFINLLRRRPLGPAEIALVEPLASSLGNLTGMLNGLLQVARLEAGILSAEPRDFPLDELLQRLFDEFREAARLTGLCLQVPPVRLNVRSDPLLVELILRNLLSNALKYTRAGSVSVLARAGDGHVAVAVTDTGPGIAPGDLERIFEEYYQGADVARDHSRGFGIGLATARRVAALLGTRIEVSSEPGRGSTFSLCLPLGAIPDAASPATVLDTAPDLLAGCSALVIDDEPLVLQAIELMLASWGVRVQVARTLEQVGAVLAGLDHPLDIVVADYSLGHGQCGTDAVAAARRRGAWAAVLLTGDTSPERLAEARRSGCHLLHKPVTAEVLETLLRTVCRERREVSSS
ncbi:PAS domain-containing protein [Skermanella aerolata]|uniref:PAS domain-containing protein n=1 Tax=Skermanella aerolata TaxID=393310 RepID=UPI0005E2205C|nr:PAS domain-containing protein [Skermanella aerolata]KJB91418.1 hypothetical protein N826_30705 [Skermanella aerolata KACC 11604]